VATTEIRFMQP